MPISEVELYRRKIVSVNSNEGAATSFMVKPKKIGNIPIKVTARTSRTGDTVEKILKVVPEGVTVYESSAILIDLRDKSNFDGNLSVTIPKNAVSDSTHIEVAVVGS